MKERRSSLSSRRSAQEGRQEEPGHGSRKSRRGSPAGRQAGRQAAGRHFPLETPSPPHTHPTPAHPPGALCGTGC